MTGVADNPKMTVNDPCLLVLPPWDNLLFWIRDLSASNQQNMAKMMGCHYRDYLTLCVSLHLASRATGETPSH